MANGNDSESTYGPFVRIRRRHTNSNRTKKRVKFTTPQGVQIGPIRIPVANTYDNPDVNNETPEQQVHSRVNEGHKRVMFRYPSRIHVVSQDCYDTTSGDDVDNEYDYIMNKALRSYKQHRSKEKAENRQRQLKSAYHRRWQAPLVPSKVRICSSAPQTRSKPMIPAKMDAIKEVEDANLCDGSDERQTTYRRYTPVPPATTVEVKRINISMDDSRKSQNFSRRNQSTHTWHSHSFPSASYLNNHMRLHFQQAAQSRVEQLPAAGKPAIDRPQSAYSYDGGVFSPKGPKRDYFVIHPDWVSEAMTIQKLSLKEKLPKTGTWPGRRCKSAPPPNQRNPITWEVGMEASTQNTQY